MKDLDKIVNSTIAGLMVASAITSEVMADGFAPGGTNGTTTRTNAANEKSKEQWQAQYVSSGSACNGSYTTDPGNRGKIKGSYDPGNCSRDCGGTWTHDCGGTWTYDCGNSYSYDCGNKYSYTKYGRSPQTCYKVAGGRCGGHGTGNVCTNPYAYYSSYTCYGQTSATSGGWNAKTCGGGNAKSCTDGTAKTCTDGTAKTCGDASCGNTATCYQIPTGGNAWSEGKDSSSETKPDESGSDAHKFKLNTRTVYSYPGKLGTPTVSVSAEGIVTGGAVANANKYQISIDNVNWSDATSGVNFKSAIISSAGPRTVYVRAMDSNNILLTSTPGSYTVTVHTVSFNPNGGSSVNSINAINGGSVTLPAGSIKKGYTFSQWKKK